MLPFSFDLEVHKMHLFVQFFIRFYNMSLSLLQIDECIPLHCMQQDKNDKNGLLFLSGAEGKKYAAEQADLWHLERSNSLRKYNDHPLVSYLRALPQDEVYKWIVRGLGSTTLRNSVGQNNILINCSRENLLSLQENCETIQQVFSLVFHDPKVQVFFHTETPFVRIQFANNFDPILEDIFLFPDYDYAMFAFVDYDALTW